MNLGAHFPGGEVAFRACLYAELLRSLWKWTQTQGEFPQGLWLFHCRLLTEWSELKITDSRVFSQFVQDVVSTVIWDLSRRINDDNRWLFEKMVDLIVVSARRGDAEEVITRIVRNPMCFLSNENVRTNFPLFVYENTGVQIPRVLEFRRAWVRQLEIFRAHVAVTPVSARQVARALADVTHAEIRSRGSLETKTDDVKGGLVHAYLSAWKSVFPTFTPSMQKAMATVFSQFHYYPARVPMTIGPGWLKADVLMDYGCTDALSDGGRLIANIELFCSKHVSEGQVVVGTLLQMESTMYVFDGGKRFDLFKHLLDEVRSELVVSKEAILEHVIEPALAGKAISDPATFTALRDQREKLKRIELGHGTFLAFVVERCLFGFQALARRLGRALTVQEGALAVEQVATCVRSAVAIGRTHGVQSHVMPPQEAYDFFGQVCPDASASAKKAWVGLWSPFMYSYMMSANHEEDDQEEFLDIAEELSQIPGFFFHKSWKPPQVVTTPASIYAVLGSLGIITGAPDISPLYRGFRRASDARFLDVEGGFAVFSEPDGFLAEVLRDPDLMNKSVGALMPQVNALGYLESQACGKTLMEFRDSIPNTVRRHLQHWRLLQKTKVVDKIPLSLLMALVADILPCMRERMRLRNPEIDDDPCQDYVKLFHHFFVEVDDVVRQVYGSRKRSSLSVPLTELIVCNWSSHSGLLIGVDPITRLGTYKKEEFTIGSEAEGLEPAWLSDRKRHFKRLGVVVRGDGDFEGELNEIFSKAEVYLRNVQRMRRVDAEGGVLFFPDCMRDYLAFPLHCLYTRYLVHPVDCEKWEAYHEENARKLVKKIAVYPAQRRVVDRVGIEKFVDIFVAHFVQPRVESQVFSDISELTGSASASAKALTPEDMVAYYVDQIEKLGPAVIDEIGMPFFYHKLMYSGFDVAVIHNQLASRCAVYLDPQSQHPLAYWVQRLELFLRHAYYPLNFVQSRSEMSFSSPPSVETLLHDTADVVLPVADQAANTGDYPVASSEPVLVRKDGFCGTPESVTSLNSKISTRLALFVTSWPEAAARVPFEQAVDLVDSVRATVDASGLLVTDHSGFVAMLKRELTALLADKFPAIDSGRVALLLASLIGSIGIEKDKNRRKAVASAKEGLVEWFEVGEEIPGSSPDAVRPVGVTEDAPQGDGEETVYEEPTKDIPNAEPLLVKDLGVDVSGIVGDTKRMTVFKVELVRILATAFQEMNATLQKKGVLSVVKLDELRESVRLEYLDQGLRVGSNEAWGKFLTEIVGSSSVPLINRVAALVAVVLASESGKDTKTANARRLLSEDKRSPFCKQMVIKQSDGTYKFRVLGEDVEWSGLLLQEEKIAKFQGHVAETVRQLDNTLEAHRDDYPKPFAVVEQFADEIEIGRFDVEAVVNDISVLQEYLQHALMQADFNEWHARMLARFAILQYLDPAEEAKERAFVKEALLTERQSDFAEDPYLGWRPVVSDGRLKMTQLPRVIYESVGFSLQAEIDDEKFLVILTKILNDHFSRWRRQPRPFSWGVMDALVRDLRVEALRYLLNIEEPAVMTIVLEEQTSLMAPGLNVLIKAVTNPDLLRGLIAEYLVLMLQVRPDSKSVAELKTKLLAFTTFFTTKETLGPRPVNFDSGFAIPGEEDPLAAAQRISEGVEDLVAKHAERWERHGELPEAKQISLCYQDFREFVKDERLTVHDSKAFKRFLYPLVGLSVKNCAPSLDFSSTLDVIVDFFVSGATCKEGADTRLESPVVHSSRLPINNDVFDGSRHEMYLEWRYLVLSKIPLSEMGSKAATHILLAAASFLEVRALVRNSDMNAASMFHAILWYMNSRFDNKAAHEYIVRELSSEIDQKRLARLLSIKSLFLAPFGERAEIQAFIESVPKQSDRDIARVLFGFGDQKLVIFKARLKAFLVATTNK